MLQAALLDRSFLDLVPFSENGFVAPEVADFAVAAHGRNDGPHRSMSEAG